MIPTRRARRRRKRSNRRRSEGGKWEDARFGREPSVVECELSFRIKAEWGAMLFKLLFGVGVRG